MPAKDLFLKTVDLMGQFFEKFDPEIVDQLIDELKASQALLFFSGVGKSGLIAQKIAVTMTSTGSRALFLPPTDSLHGDMGLVGNEDYVFLISKSGESEELLSMIPALRNRGAKVIAITSSPRSRLSLACQRTLLLPATKELCPYDMAPTLSTTQQLIFGDLLAIGLMEAKGFSAYDFAMNHPAGKLGKRALMKVSDLMIKEDGLPLAMPDQKLINSLVDLSDKKAGCLMIKGHDGELLGIFTDGDLRRALQNHGSKVLEMTLSEIMIKNPKHTHPDTLIVDALSIMEGNQKSPVMVLPVIDDKNIICGLIKLHDIIQTGV